MLIRCCLFLLTISGMIPDAKAQQQPTADSPNVIARADFLSLLVPPEEVEGRVYLFEDWQQGAVFLSQGKFASGITFNYDVLNHALLVLVDEKEYSLNPIAVDSILLANRSQVLINPLILDGVGSDLLLLRLYESANLSLFRNTVAKVMEGDNNTTTTTELVYADTDLQINQQQKYFLLNKASDELRELQGKKKGLKKWENGDQLVDFVKDQNLDLKNEADLIQVVQYYEQLTFVKE